MPRGAGVHPAIRVLLLVVVAAALPAQGLFALTIWLLVSISALHLSGVAALKRLRMGIWRLRWLLLAIAVAYVGFTPGTPLLPALPGISREGLAEGLRRALVLVDVLALVYLLLAHTPVNELLVALRTLATPLRLLGVDPQRVGMRLALTMDAVGTMQERLQASRTLPDSQIDSQTDSQSGRPPGSQPQSLWQRAAGLIAEIEANADAPQTVTLATLPAPRWWQWGLVPLAFLLLHDETWLWIAP